MRYLLSHLLTEAVDRCPERPALVDRTRTITYVELETRAGRLARLLQDEVRVRRGDRVGIYLDKSAEAIVAIHGVLKAGAAYVPLDGTAPASRVAHMVRDCGIRCLLTGRERAAHWPALVGPVTSLVVMNAAGDACAPPAGARLYGTDAIDAHPAHPADASPLSVDLAYILYTSGSTGLPKGVMLSHRNALTFVEWAAETFRIGPGDRLSNHAPLHFDLSIFDIFAANRGAAATVLVEPNRSMLPADVARFIDAQAITIWYSVPSILGMLARRGGLVPGCFPRLRDVLFAGEVFPSRHLRRLMTLLPHAGFHNLYGPTETNVCTYHRVAALPAESDPIPIGRPVADVEVVVLREDGTPAATGEPGELCVRGATVMQGYWGDPERTARSFHEGRRYRTGDIVRRDADGDHWYLGRGDDQVKSRGYRIALGDVEAAVLAHPSVDECAVVPVPDEMVTSRLVACVVCRGPLDDGELVRWCAERIPRYMIPERFECRSTLPKTSSGKVDRQALLGSMAVKGRPTCSPSPLVGEGGGGGAPDHGSGRQPP